MGQDGGYREAEGGWAKEVKEGGKGNEQTEEGEKWRGRWRGGNERIKTGATEGRRKQREEGEGEQERQSVGTKRIQRKGEGPNVKEGEGNRATVRERGEGRTKGTGVRVGRSMQTFWVVWGREGWQRENNKRGRKTNQKHGEERQEERKGENDKERSRSEGRGKKEANEKEWGRGKKQGSGVLVGQQEARGCLWVFLWKGSGLIGSRHVFVGVRCSSRLQSVLGDVVVLLSLALGATSTFHYS